MRINSVEIMKDNHKVTEYVVTELLSKGYVCDESPNTLVVSTFLENFRSAATEYIREFGYTGGDLMCIGEMSEVGAGYMLYDTETIAYHDAIYKIKAIMEYKVAIHNSDQVISGNKFSQCNTCESKMVHRIAKRGATIGMEFLGCTNYPKCNNTEKLPF